MTVLQLVDYEPRVSDDWAAENREGRTLFAAVAAQARAEYEPALIMFAARRLRREGRRGVLAGFEIAWAAAATN